jgi:tRNA(fMet)-specific endonuclease VapC
MFVGSLDWSSRFAKKIKDQKALAKSLPVDYERTMTVLESILQNVQSLPLRQQVEVARYTQALNTDLAQKRHEILGQTHGGLDEADGHIFTEATLRSRSLETDAWSHNRSFTGYKRRHRPFAWRNWSAFPLHTQPTTLYFSGCLGGNFYKGAYKSNKPVENRQLIDRLLNLVALLFPDTATAEAYAHISCELQNKGTPIPENDIWIAAVARECDLTLATRDTHFSQVSALRMVYW